MARLMPKKRIDQDSHPRQWRKLFEQFIQEIRIDSKELTGSQPLGKILYGAQYRFLDEVCAGLENGQREFTCLKARQLGISTISLAIDIFWMVVFEATQGALIADTPANLDNFRRIIARYLKSLPAGYKVPIVKDNRMGLEFANGSILQYLVAGKRGTADLGTSRALNFIHATEVAKWGDSAGITSLRATLAEKHPNRLYIWESTAKGHNHFYRMWNAANEDQHTQRAFFIGWWAKEAYRIEKDDPRYAQYMEDPPTEEEREKAAIVSDAYGWSVQPEQLAWYRWWSIARAGQGGDEDETGSMEENYPWHEQEAFVVTGSHFFPARRLSQDLKKVHTDPDYKFSAFRYLLGEEFTNTEMDIMDIEVVKRSSLAHLRVWERPVDHGIYDIGVDPAFGRNDWADQHCISVWRAYADRLDQVAEYATAEPETYPVIWVLAHLASMYRNCRINLEINGPGATIQQGLKHLKAHLRGMVVAKGEPDYPRSFLDALSGARWFLYHRPDSMASGYVYNFKTNSDNKFVIMNGLRDSYILGNLIVRSGPMLEQMETIIQETGEISAFGKGKDDRVFAAALAHHAWTEWDRNPLRARGRAYAIVRQEEREAAAKGVKPQETGLVGQIVRHTFAMAQVRRAEVARNRAIGRLA